MSHPEYPQLCSSVLLVEPTGGGKSSVRDTHAIVPLLSLGTDQAQKMKRFSKAESGIINSINLDDYKNEESRRCIVTDLLTYEHNTQQTFLLFSSPQTIVNSKCFQDFIATINSKTMLTMVCIDEIQLFVKFGKSGFRKEFSELKRYLFDLFGIIHMDPLQTLQSEPKCQYFG
jgi:superfamily II DNA helicase RecQ